MKRVHTQKKSANRPFSGAHPNYAYNYRNSFKTGLHHDPSQKLKRPAYKRAIPLA